MIVFDNFFFQMAITTVFAFILFSYFYLLPIDFTAEWKSQTYKTHFDNNGAKMYLGVLVFSEQNQVPQTIIGISGVIYHIKTFSVEIRTASKNFQKTFVLSSRKARSIFFSV